MIFKKNQPGDRGPVTDHFNGTRFYVPGHPGDKTAKDMLKWTLGEKRVRWPKQFPTVHGEPTPQRVVGIRSTLIGHASFLLQIANKNILIDPVFSNRASPVTFAGPKRVNAPGIALAELPPIDAVLITHNHYDHLDKASLWAIEQRWQPQFIGPLGTDLDVMRKRKLPQHLATLDWGGSFSLGGVTVHAVPTYHWSARGMRDRHKSLWCSYVVTSPAGAVYHIGDTGYGAGFFSRDVKAKFGRINLAHIPIGAYEPRWFMKDHHVNPEEAVQIFQDCGAKAAIGHHWGTFQLTNEGHDEPQKDLATALNAAALAPNVFQAFRPGQVWHME